MPVCSAPTVGDRVRSIFLAMMFDQGFSIHHEAHKGHEVRTTGLEKQPDFNMLFSVFVLFVSFVVVYFG